ncbi:hypothetical protein [Streptomyces tsukubensis]|uniref:DUF8175 domain-containing protein n=1 Tax=Streptomyces tsukubensis TaxID=83656 RepID=A0A1V4A8J6_9ACTN|nr:hypothetical protein [Streptomyces tsukubensis]OON78879.1 hypothetical protein B1H18_16135 [Streptomyces tsukubensis]QFR94360.1 hypothetical protein GBW32_16470 [Streptomyces tsukubensis]
MSAGDEHGYGGDPGRRDDDFGGTGQTRTRLPGRTDGTRRPARTSRSLVTVVGVVVLLIAAIAFANRGGGGDNGGEDKKPTAATGGAAPTAASGKRPTTDKNTAGIPSGFAKSKEGAQSAASNYAVALVSADILKPARRGAIVKQIFTADKAPALEAKLDKAYSKDFLDKVGLDSDGNAPQGDTYVSRTMPVGTKATAYGSNTATVEVWCTGVFGMAAEKSTSPVTSDWFTMTLTLRWADSDWKVESFSQKDGPAPVNGDNKVSSADEIAKAVEQYGGFTYAR